MSRFSRVCSYIRIKICKKEKERNKFMFKNKRIRIARAPEPSDLYWKNIPMKMSDKVWRILFTYFIMLVVLWIAFVIYYLLAIAKNKLDDTIAKNGDKSNPYLWILTFAISCISGIIVSLVNIILQYLIRLLSNEEKNATHTGISLTIGLKLVFALFINTALTPLFVNLKTKDWFSRSGLVMDIFFNTVSVCFVGPILSLFSVSFFIKKLRIWLERWRGENSQYTQRRMNQLHEGESLNASYLYASTMLLLMICAFYAALIPYLPIVCLFGSFFQYYFQKWTVIRFYKVPERIDGFIESSMRSMFPLVIFLYALGQFIFINRLSDHSNQTCFIVLMIALLYMILPSRVTFAYFWNDEKVNENEEDTYEKSWHLFKPDYVESNPVEFLGVSGFLKLIWGFNRQLMMRSQWRSKV